MGFKKKVKNGIRSVIQMTKEEKLYPVPQPTNVQQVLSGKVALITGGTGGIGFVIAEAFIQAGCKVIICGTNEDKLDSCVEKINREEVLLGLVLNVLDVDSMPAKIEQAAAMFHEKRIDILVNSAGVVAHSSCLNMTEKEYDTIMDINAKGTFFMSQAMSRYMIEKGIKGHILNVTSSSALRPAWTAYQMSKWAVRGFTIGLADVLLPYGIIVNAIAPGPVATGMLGKQEGDSIASPMQPSGRYAVPSEIASMATFLVSDMGNLVVGDTVYMTGGSGVIDLKH
ncbi:MAG: SDR family oxidoreductase [Lachnospiraceae bacterium]|nr:SDR family oxidoreductase [Lachnospiraceae bacterium]